MEADLAARSNLMPAYVAGLIVRGPEPELQGYFSTVINKVGEEEEGWSQGQHLGGLRQALELIGSRNGQKLDSILSVLRELVIATTPKVREVTASLLERLVSLSSENVVRTTILPAIATLSNDEDVNVRKQVGNALGSVMASSNEEKVLEKISFQLDGLLDAKDPEIQESVMLMLADVCSAVDADFRDKYLFSKIRSVAVSNAEQEDEELKSRVANSVFTAYKIFLECGPSIEVLANEVLLGLELLQKQLTVEENLKSVQAAIATIRVKAGIPAPTEITAGGSGSTNGADDSGTNNSNNNNNDGDNEGAGEEKKDEVSLQEKAKSILERFKFGKDKKASTDGE
jgi:hypothetical protein